MNLQELLKAKGMTDEQIADVANDMKANRLFIVGEENLDIRYSKLKADHDSLVAQHGESAKLIEQFKNDAKSNEILQGKIAGYEATIADLTKQLSDTQIEAAMDRRLTAAGAKADDLDYLKFQWRKKGEITLDDNGEIKGGDDVIAGLKTQHPVQFTSAGKERELQPHKLPKTDSSTGATTTKEEFEKMGYDSRVKLKEADPELYNQLTKG